MQRSKDDCGSITAFVVMLTMTFVACAGLAVDGGRLVAAKVQLADQAENAARAGTQEIMALRTGDPKVDVDRAIMTAENFMAQASNTWEGKRYAVRGNSDNYANCHDVVTEIIWGGKPTY